MAAGLDAAHLHRRVVEERVEQADGIRAAADAGEEQVGQAALLLQNLPAGLVANNSVEVADHDRIRMRAVGGAEDVVGAADVGHPVAHGLVDGFLERLLAGMHGHHVSAQHLHAVDVQLLPHAVHGSHVDHALEAEHRRDRGGRNAVLPGAGLGDDAGLAHALGDEGLAEGVIDLVRAGVQQVLALQVDFRAAEFLGEAFGEVERRGPADEFAQVVAEFALELRVLLRSEVFGLQLLERIPERLRDVTAAELPEPALVVGHGGRGELRRRGGRGRRAHRVGRR